MLILDCISEYSVDWESSLFLALDLIDRNNAKAVIVVRSGFAIGVVTDGDIRKALLNRRTLDAPIRDVMNEAFKFCLNENEATLLFEEFPYISILPIVDSPSNKRLLKVAVRF